MATIQQALKTFTDTISNEGGIVNIDNVDYDKLKKAIKEERKSGQHGTKLEIITDLYDCIGLDQFGIIID